MRNPLRKRYTRDLKKNSGRYISIFLMLMVTIALMSGFLSVTDGIQVAFMENRKACKLEDGLFSSYNKINADTIGNVEILGVSVYENYYIDESIKDDRVLRIYKNRENTNLVTVMKGKMPESRDEIAIERLFAENNSYAIGDTMTLSGSDRRITGYVSMPDYSSLFEKNSNLMMDAFSFGIGIVTEEVFESYSKDALTYNYSYYFNDRSLSKGEKRDLSNDILDSLVENKVMLTNFCTAENNNSISFVEDDLGSDVPLMKVLLNIIIVIMAFVYSIVISSTIDAEATIIGTLLASGYGKHELIRHYIGLPIIVTFISAVIGNLLGYTVMPILFIDMTYGSFSLPPMKIRLNMEALLLTTIVPILIMIIINYVTLFRKLSISPLNFLRRELNKKNNRRPVKLPNLSFFSRFRLRIIIQNRTNYLTLFIGVFFASVILMFGLCISPLIENYVDSIRSTTISNYQYILKAPIEAGQENTAEKFVFTSLETYHKPSNKNLEVSFYGINEKSKYLSKMSLSDDDPSVYISDGLAKKLKKKAGDTVIFVNPYTRDEYNLMISDIYEYPAGLAVFMNQKQLNALMDYDEAYFNGYFSNTELAFENENNLAAVITPEDMVELGDQMTSSFSQMAPIALGIAVIIYLVLMYILTKIVIDKNAIHISFMKVFGYIDKEIKKLYLAPTTIVIIVSLLLGLPLTSFTMKICFEFAMMKVGGYIPVYIPAYIYAEIVVIGMMTYFFINFFQKKKVGQIEMADSLKNRE
ncbi:MAG: ABC transporter permease [Herbinix sp.]|nr:ABC transporter permease [Herbinix sp.]